MAPIIIAAKVRFKVPPLTAISSRITDSPSIEALIFFVREYNTSRQISTYEHRREDNEIERFGN